MVDTFQDGPLAGVQGHVKFDGTDVGGVIEWKIDPKIDKKDITAFGTGATAVAWKSYLATLRDATITLTLAYLDMTDAGQQKLWDRMMDGVAKEIKMYFDQKHYCSCTAWVETFPVGAKVDDVEGTGTNITLQLTTAITIGEDA